MGEPSEISVTTSEDDEDLSLHYSSSTGVLHEIFKELSVGKDGFLNVDELYAVCEHIGMQLESDVVEQLFEKLDYDRDGRISFEELLQGFFEHNRTKARDEDVDTFFKSDVSPQKISPNTSQYFQAPQGGYPVKSVKDKPSKCSLGEDEISEKRNSDDQALSSMSGGYFQLLDPLNIGYTDFESIVSLWESLGFSNARNILKSLGFDRESNQINVRDLSLVLEEELFGSFSKGSELFQISLVLFHQELGYVKFLYEQTKAERDQLRCNLTEANDRADLLAQEVDDHHAQLEKTSKEELTMLEKRYHEQMHRVQSEFQSERENLSQQIMNLRKERASAQSLAVENQMKLENIISSLKVDNLSLEREVQELTDRLAEVLKMNIELQRELEESYCMRKRCSDLEIRMNTEKDAEYQSLMQDNEVLNRQNKELRDENDGLWLKLERMSQKSDKKEYKSSSKTPKRSRNFRNSQISSNVSKQETSSTLSSKRRDHSLSIQGQTAKRKAQDSLFSEVRSASPSRQSLSTQADFIKVHSGLKGVEDEKVASESTTYQAVSHRTRVEDDGSENKENMLSGDKLLKVLQFSHQLLHKNQNNSTISSGSLKKYRKQGCKSTDLKQILRDTLKDFVIPAVRKVQNDGEGLEDKLMLFFESFFSQILESSASESSAGSSSSLPHPHVNHHALGSSHSIDASPESI
ncbi:ninein-like protein [Brevipalpus obovatus]|uniref:ninein-like protein n=1 Tax=Brevipalpus obovatus TaxID=246614 RepID=UPI003D9DCDE6